MICAFSSCHHKTTSDSDSEQSILGLSVTESESESEVGEGSKSESDSKSTPSRNKSSRSSGGQRKKVDGKEKESAKSMSNPKDLMQLLEARQQTLCVQSEKRSLICRALQCQWLLIQKHLGMWRKWRKFSCIMHCERDEESKMMIFIVYFIFPTESKGGGDSLYDNAYLMLEPEFQPISPATDISESMRIFEEHKKVSVIL